MGDSPLPPTWLTHPPQSSIIALAGRTDWTIRRQRHRPILPNRMRNSSSSCFMCLWIIAEVFLWIRALVVADEWRLLLSFVSLATAVPAAAVFNVRLRYYYESWMLRLSWWNSQLIITAMHLLFYFSAKKALRMQEKKSKKYAENQREINLSKFLLLLLIILVCA